MYCQRPGDYNIDPYESINASTMLWRPGYTQLVISWSLASALKGKSHKYLFYVNGIVVDRDAISPKVITTTQNVVPNINVVAINPICDYDSAYDPLCGSTDFANVNTFWDSSIQAPCRVDLNVLAGTVKVYFRRTQYYYYHVVIDGVLKDTDAKSGHTSYTTTYTPESDTFPAVSLIPLPAKSSNFLSWGAELTDTFFNRICPDVILPKFKYIAQEFPLTEQVFGKTKKNYISISDKQNGYSVPQPGSQISVGGKQKVVLGPRDYRHTTQFDKFRFYTIFKPTSLDATIPCEAKGLALGTTVFINTHEGPVDTNSVE